MKLLKQGAEAKIFLDGNSIIKERISKSYRIKDIDKKLRLYRTRSEAKILDKCSSIINVPSLFNVDEIGMKIKMEFINGKLLRDLLNDLNEEEKKEIFFYIGNEIAVLHDNNIIHQDLTTSNMVLFNKKVYFIDFGLSFISDRVEDKAVDLHLLKQALNAKHYLYAEECFDNVLEGYRKSKNYSKIIERLDKVERRGKYK
ncbi:Kae1-associated serine/threonine protein kinase [Candidatus Woesearchaeota archaeon]|nr:Kae1-associated serine/threonine protein kinase [Candidatus Woesearchaeota archaeon]